MEPPSVLFLQLTMNAQEFIALVGRQPVFDDLERVNCKHAGEPGHFQCGLCPKCGKPRFVCGHVRGIDPDVHDNTDL